MERWLGTHMHSVVQTLGRKSRKRNEMDGRRRRRREVGVIDGRTSALTDGGLAGELHDWPGPRDDRCSFC